MSHSTESSVLLMLSSDIHKEDTPSNTAIDKSCESFYPNGKTPYKQRIPMSPQDNSPLINGQHEVSNVSSSTGSLQSTSQFEFENLPTWTLLPPGNGSTITTSPAGDSAYEGDELQANKSLDIDEELCKRQKIQNGSTARNGPIEISNVLLKSPAERSTLVDGEPRKARLPRRQNSGTPAPLAPVGSSDARVDKTSLLAVENTKRVELSSITSISSNLSLGPTTVIGSKLASRQSLSVTQESLTSHSRKRTYGLAGILVPRPLAMSESTSTSDFSNSEAFKDPEEPPRKTRRLALRPTNPSYGAKLKKSLGREADQSELELWTNADVARVRFMKPDELRLHDEGEEENVKRTVSCILASLMEMEEDVARNQRKISKGVQNQVAMPASSIYTRCDDLVEEIFGPDSGNRGMTLHKPRMNASNSHRSSIDNDGDKEDEEMRYDTNSLQVPLAQLEDWSTALRSLIKGKKRFQDQDLINLKNTLQEIYNNRAKISATSSLAQALYELSRLGAHDVPNRDELGLRALARQSM